MSRILVLCYEYPPIGGGGGRVAAQVAAALVERGHHVRVVTAGMQHLPRYQVIDGVEVLRVRSWRKREDTCSVLEMLLWVIMASPIACIQAWRWKPKVIHAHFAVPTGALAWLVYHLTSIPYVLTAHLGDVPGGVPAQTDHLFKRVKWLTIPIWKQAAQITAVSSFVATLAEKAYHRKAQVILNGLKLPEQISVKTHDSPHLLFVGRLSIQKNLLMAIQALALLTDLPWRFSIIGDGPLATAAQEEVRKLHLEERISFLGWLSASEVQHTMKAADILLMPSLAEGLPMAGVEALGYGLAIVGSRIGGLQDILLEGKNGASFHLEAGAAELAHVLRPFLTHTELLAKAQEESRKLSLAFEWEQSIARYEKVLLS